MYVVPSTFSCTFTGVRNRKINNGNGIYLKMQSENAFRCHLSMIECETSNMEEWRTSTATESAFLSVCSGALHDCWVCASILLLPHKKYIRGVGQVKNPTSISMRQRQKTTSKYVSSRTWKVLSLPRNSLKYRLFVPFNRQPFYSRHIFKEKKEELK